MDPYKRELEEAIPGIWQEHVQELRAGGAEPVQIEGKVLAGTGALFKNHALWVLLQADGKSVQDKARAILHYFILRNEPFVQMSKHLNEQFDTVSRYLREESVRERMQVPGVVRYAEQAPRLTEDHYAFSSCLFYYMQFRLNQRFDNLGLMYNGGMFSHLYTGCYDVQASTELILRTIIPEIAPTRDSGFLVKIAKGYLTYVRVLELGVYDPMTKITFHQSQIYQPVLLDTKLPNLPPQLHNVCRHINTHIDKKTDILLEKVDAREDPLSPLKGYRHILLSTTFWGPYIVYFDLGYCTELMPVKPH